MFRIWKKRQKISAGRHIRAARGEPDYFENLPFIDNETLDQFLADPENLERLPVDPTEYRPEFQRLIVSAFFHEASTRAKRVEHV
jgi:hypothetical protein